jgi:hypothetical protein
MMQFGLFNSSLAVWRMRSMKAAMARTNREAAKISRAKAFFR